METLTNKVGRSSFPRPCETGSKRTIGHAPAGMDQCGTQLGADPISYAVQQGGGFHHQSQGSLRSAGPEELRVRKAF